MVLRPPTAAIARVATLFPCMSRCGSGPVTQKVEHRSHITNEVNKTTAMVANVKVLVL